MNPIYLPVKLCLHKLVKRRGGATLEVAALTGMLGQSTRNLGFLRERFVLQKRRSFSEKTKQKRCQNQK